MDKMKFHAAMLRTLVIPIALAVLIVAPRTVSAQSAQEATQISIGAPAQANLGTPLTVQALLVDSRGNPISKETVYFTTNATFLNNSGDVVLAQAVTNKDGQAVAEFTDDFSEAITLHAEFRGDAQYAASNATAQIAAVGEDQVYVDHIGVDIPGFNVPPVGAPQASIQSQQGLAGFIRSLWPAMNGWPIAAVLLLVWATYFFAVTFVFRVAAAGRENDEDPASSNPGSSL